VRAGRQASLPRRLHRRSEWPGKGVRKIQNGDVVVTTGGIVGTIVSITDDKLILRVKPSDIKLEFLRSAVASRDTAKEVTKV